MNPKLLAALSVGKTLDLINRQKKLLHEKFVEDSQFYYNGGKFISTVDLLGFIEAHNARNNIVLIDEDNIPILIDDLDDFRTTAWLKYESASTTYHAEYNKLINQARDASV